MSKSIPICWPATIHRRETFLPPVQYSHRAGRTANAMLARARHAVLSLSEYEKRLSESVWAIGDMDEATLPARAEDLLWVLASDKRLGETRRGLTLAEVASRYITPQCEASRLIATLSTCLANHKTMRVGGEWVLRLSDVVSAFNECRYTLEPEPLIP